jgi:hypothetical protein
MRRKRSLETISFLTGGVRAAFQQNPIKREDFAKWTQYALKQQPRKAKSKRFDSVPVNEIEQARPSDI